MLERERERERVLEYFSLYYLRYFFTLHIRSPWDKAFVKLARPSAWAGQAEPDTTTVSDTHRTLTLHRCTLLANNNTSDMDNSRAALGVGEHTPDRSGTLVGTDAVTTADSMVRGAQNTVTHSIE